MAEAWLDVFIDHALAFILHQQFDLGRGLTFLLSLIN
jgi:hypothetical protein